MTIFASGLGGITRVKTAGGGGGVTTPVILGSVTTGINSTEPHTSHNFAHTVTAGTEVLLLIVLYGPNTNGGSEATPSSNVNGNFSLLSGAVFSPISTLAMPRTGVWALTSPTSGAHTITYGVATADLDYSAGVAINLDDTDTGDPFGDIENVKVNGTPSNTLSSSLTTEKAGSRIIAWGAWQGGDADPIGEDLGLTQLAEFQTGGAGVTDGAMSVATLVGPTPAGAVPYGFTASVSDDYAYGAVEIRGA